MRQDWQGGVECGGLPSLMACRGVAARWGRAPTNSCVRRAGRDDGGRLVLPRRAAPVELENVWLLINLGLVPPVLEVALRVVPPLPQSSQTMDVPFCPVTGLRQELDQ